MVLDLQCDTHYPGNQMLTKESLVKASSNGYQNTSFGGVGMTPMEWHVHALKQAEWGHYAYELAKIGIFTKAYEWVRVVIESLNSTNMG